MHIPSSALPFLRSEKRKTWVVRAPCKDANTSSALPYLDLRLSLRWGGLESSSARPQQKLSQSQRSKIITAHSCACFNFNGGAHGKCVGMAWLFTEISSRSLRKGRTRGNEKLFKRYESLLEDFIMVHFNIFYRFAMKLWRRRPGLRSLDNRDYTFRIKPVFKLI